MSEKTLLSLGSNQPFDDLYRAHIAHQITLAERLCERFGLAYILIASGGITYHFKDDREYPFKVNPFFKQWLPLTDAPDAYLLLTPGQRPTLFLPKPDDIWLAWPGLQNCDWHAEEAIQTLFEVIEVKHRKDITAYLPEARGHRSFIGPEICLHSNWNINSVNDEAIFNFMQFYRGYKSEYEVACLYQANLNAVPGHRRAESIFKAGGTERDIFLAYIHAINTVQQDDPYEPIIALNQHSAILHYQLKEKTPPADGHQSLLIDAGAAFAGYAADITRTISFNDSEFNELIAQFDTLQRRLVASIDAGTTHLSLYQRSRYAVSEFMVANGFATCSAEALCEDDIIDSFYPHGLSHFLGVQVHDIGLPLQDDTGRQVPCDTHYPRLQYQRQLEVGMVFTVEPGFYFIEQRLAALHSSKHANVINWKTVARFLPFGGIRIEDDVSIREEGVMNLTRQAFDQANTHRIKQCSCSSTTP